LKLNGDCWEAFLLRNGFASPEIGQVDKSVVTETLVGLVISPPLLLSSAKPSTYPNTTQPENLHDSCPKNGGKLVKKSAKKKGKGNSDINYKGKKAAHWISRCARNKPKENTDQKPILLSEDYDSEIEGFYWQPNHIFPLSYKLPTPTFCKHRFFVAIFK
jgi:hypothetical protein